jgi:aspartyl aminopeptidase
VSTVDDLMAFISASPSPYHAVAEASRRLTEAGFVQLDLAAAWPDGPGSWFAVRGGTLVAWIVSPEAAGTASAGFRLVGAHTDSPNLRIKPRPDTGGFGWQQLGVEVYGGALWNSWLDRDLGLSGRVTTNGDTYLVRHDEPLMRVPQLAIHLDRDVNGQGLKLNPQQHLTPIWGAGAPTEGAFSAFLVELLATQGDHLEDGEQIRGWDLMLHDLTPPALLGRDRELLAAARLDNLGSCWAALEAITSSRSTTSSTAEVPVICLYDHEEIGSMSATGADGAFLTHLLERTVLARGGMRDDYLRALASSVCVSADAAHATHPNYPERHDPGHLVTIDGGPVVKVNAGQRYASNAESENILLEAFDRAGVPHQWFVSRNDMACGSTIGPITSARLGMQTVDVGIAQLSMHSARELCGADEPERLAAVLEAFFKIGSPATDDGVWLNDGPDGEAGGEAQP